MKWSRTKKQGSSSNMKAKYLKSLIYRTEELSLEDLANRLEFWQKCTHQELRYGMRITDALSKANLI